MTTAERKDHILNRNDLVLAIEGRFTNLLIYKGSKDNTVHLRLDKAFNYWAHLSTERLKYLEKDHPVIETLNALYGGCDATTDDLDNILIITKNMKNRSLVQW